MEVLRVLALGSENEDGDDPTAGRKQERVQSSNRLKLSVTVVFHINEDDVHRSRPVRMKQN